MLVLQTALNSRAPLAYSVIISTSQHQLELTHLVEIIPTLLTLKVRDHRLLEDPRPFQRQFWSKFKVFIKLVFTLCKGYRTIVF